MGGCPQADLVHFSWCLGPPYIDGMVECDMEAFTVRDLRIRTRSLIRKAEAGELSVVTKHNCPVFVAVPFDEMLVKAGVALSMAIKLYRDELVSLEWAAKFSGSAISHFVEKLASQNIPVVNYPADELHDEFKMLK